MFYRIFLYNLFASSIFIFTFATEKIFHQCANMLMCQWREVMK